MGTGNRREARRAQRRVENAIKLLVMGIGLTLAPLFLSHTMIGKALGPLTPIGMLLSAAGALLLWLGRRNATESRTATLGAQQPVKEWRPGPYVPPPVDRTLAERLRASPSPLRVAGSAPVPPSTWCREVFEVIEWRRFEALVEALFRQGGFETRSQSHGADGGVDLWLYSRTQPGEAVSIVQCKHWQGRRVGVDKIRELRGVMAAQNVKRGQFATTSTFTPDAVAFARQNAINLLDVDGLLALIARRSDDQQAALLRVALEGDYWRPTCVNCGIKMVKRESRSGGAAFWGCTKFPRCRTRMQMRAQ